MLAKPLVAIACGGTGGHLFPGIAVAEELIAAGCETQLLISEKKVDRQAVRATSSMSVASLPAIGLTAGHALGFCRGFAKSLIAARAMFSQRPPQAVLAMGGFTSAPPVIAGKTCGALTFLHESNTIPGRANRWLSHIVDQGFVGFPSATRRLHTRNVVTTGTPVRPQFQVAEAASCRMALGLDPHKPVILVMGGSQGASAINRCAQKTAPNLVASVPGVQFIHLTGNRDFEGVNSFYKGLQCRAVVRPFLTEMELALGAADVAVSRAGASSLAEFAAMRLPAVLIPYPVAADNHQTFNARAFAEAGAALMLEEREATPEKLSGLIRKLLDSDARAAMRDELIRWHSPRAASQIAQKTISLIRAFGFDHTSVQACAAHAA